jgi:hypothetical protein
MSLDERIAHNESVFRDVNERIEQGRWPGEPAKPVAFRCECARLGCNKLVELTPVEYEHVRADPRHFLLLDGHELPQFEVVVERHGDYVVVEKTGEAGAAAAASDPREEG